ncbi:flagellin [Rossellomorea oryzaecorticis]|uniref:Flagellin n=1 Tax=Rossellomorea oryzaecorticis TaxID=1396505 RepID=A0ABU9K4M0_9BACI
MRINHNIAALNTYRQLNSASTAQSSSMEKLSSGLRINKAGDDAAGLAISEKMRGQIRGLDMASKNAQDGISLIATAEGALNETHSILQRMRELAVQSSNDTNTDTDRGELQKEVDELAKEITRISNNTEFNTKKLIDGTRDSGGVGASLTFQIGANTGQNVTLDITAMDAETLLVSNGTGTAATAAGGDAATTGGIDISTQTAADSAIDVINTAIETVSGERSKLGAYQNRLEHTINNLGTSSENLTAAESRIRDVDYALAA